MRRRELSVISLLVFLLIFFSSCPMGNIRQYLESIKDKPSTVYYSIGDIGPSGLGIVFYVSDGGLHGLEITPWKWQGGFYDPASTWGVPEDFIGTLTGFGTGSANTIAMDGILSAAAQLCRNCAIGDFHDWFLPSMDEWNQIYSQIALPGNFELNEVYWSSSQSSTNPHLALAIHTENGTWEYLNGDSVCYVRPIRAF